MKGGCLVADSGTDFGASAPARTFDPREAITPP